MEPNDITTFQLLHKTQVRDAVMSYKCLSAVGKKRMLILNRKWLSSVYVPTGS